MKKLIILLLAIPILFLSCTGEDGTDGIDGTDGTNGIDGRDGTNGTNGTNGIDGEDGTDGIDGEDGADFIGQVFEAELDFIASDNFEVLVELPTNIEVYESDIIMAYILVGVDDGTDIWEPLPQTLFFGDETLLYGYDYTMFDVRFFLDGTVSLNNLPSSYTDNIIFRVAILPAEMISSMDVYSLENVINSLQNDEIIFLK